MVEMGDSVHGNKSSCQNFFKKKHIWAMAVGKSHFIFVGILKLG